ERRDWAVKNVHGTAEPSVTLTLTKGAEVIKIQQPAVVAKKVPIAAGPKSCVHCAYGDFKALVFMHQETLRDFLVGPPSARERAFQRLLGVGWSQDLATAITK